MDLLAVPPELPHPRLNQSLPPVIDFHMHVAGPVFRFRHVNRCVKLLLRIVAVLDYYLIALDTAILIGYDVECLESE
jgi:hypothetical protein